VSRPVYDSNIAVSFDDFEIVERHSNVFLTDPNETPDADYRMGDQTIVADDKIVNVADFIGLRILSSVNGLPHEDAQQRGLLDLHCGG